LSGPEGRLFNVHMLLLLLLLLLLWWWLCGLQMSG
jgi:hypothetical protein